MHVNLDPWEVTALRRLDVAYLISLSDAKVKA